MKLKRNKTAAIILLMILTFSLSACGKDDTKINVATIKGPTSMGMVKLMDSSENGNTGANDYDFTIANSMDEIVPKIVSGECDIAAVPTNIAAVLYNNEDVDVSVIAINTLGILYIVENGETVTNMNTLRGKTIYASGKGALPDYALQYVLIENGIYPETDVTIEYKSEHSECLSELLSNEGSVALLPQPFVTVAQNSNENIRVALDITKEWESAENSNLIMGVIIARNDFIEKNPEAIELFLEQYKDSVDFVNTNIDEAGELIGKYGIVEAEVAKKAIPYCNIVFIDGQDMRNKLNDYYYILFHQGGNIMGESIPDEDFYYKGPEK